MIQPTSNRVYVFLTPTDMRKSFDTLAALVVKNNMKPESGDLFVFTNRSRNRFKVLLWEQGGYWLCAKRLEAGTFGVPLVQNDGDEYIMEVNLTELRLLIEGIELGRISRRKRFLLPKIE